jgi:hypothetical protein
LETGRYFLSISLSRFGFLSNGRTIACLKDAGNADDAQVYQVIKPQGDWSDLSERLERCLSDIADWMTANNQNGV